MSARSILLAEDSLDEALLTRQTLTDARVAVEFVAEPTGARAPFLRNEGPTPAPPGPTWSCST